MPINAHMRRDHMLRDTCTYYARTGRSEDASTLVKTQTYAAGVATRCMVTVPSRRWQATWPADDLTDTREIWLPMLLTAAPQDKVVYGSNTYRIMEVQDWQGFKSALMKRIEGVT